MATVSVREFMEALRADPELRAEVRREILGADLLTVPELVRENTLAIRELRVVVAQNSADIRQNSVDIAALREVVAQNSADIRQNSADIRELREVVAQNSADIRQNSADIQELRLVVAENSRAILQNSADIRELRVLVEALTGVVKLLSDDSHWLKGRMLQLDYSRNPFFILGGRRYRKVHLLNLRELGALDDAVESGLINYDAYDAVQRLDLLVAGRAGNGAEAHDFALAIEVSFTIDQDDIDRVVQRAATLRLCGYPAEPAVAGRAISEQASERARESGVAVLIEPGGARRA